MEFNVGDIIEVIGKIDGLDLTGYTGKILKKYTSGKLAIEFDCELPDNHGHGCSGLGKNGYCRYSNSGDIKNIRLFKSEEIVYEVSEELNSFLSLYKRA